VTDVYVIMAGTTSAEGTVLARNASGTRFEWPLATSSPSWYTGITNYDKGPQPWFDDRWDPAAKRLDAMGQRGVSDASLLHLLGEKPTLNLQTTYSIIAVPKTGHYECHVRTCPYPCVQ